MLSTWSKIRGFVMALALVVVSSPAWAAAEVAAESGDGHWLSAQAMALFAAAFAIGVGTIAPSLAQGKAIAKALEAIGRNPECADKVQSVLLIGLAFVESLCIYALVIAFMAIGKVG